MCRSFLDAPVGREALDRAFALATRAPSAGKAQGWAFVVLEGGDTAKFWEHQADSSWLAHPSHPGLLNAPVIVLPLASRASYLERYSEPDKAPAGPGRVEEWTVPYWLVDTAFATMLLLLGLAEEGLGALFFALRKPPEPLLGQLGVPRRLATHRSSGLGLAQPGRQAFLSASRPRKRWPKWSTGAVGESSEQPRPAGSRPPAAPGRGLGVLTLAVAVLVGGTTGCAAAARGLSLEYIYARTVLAKTAQTAVDVHIDAPRAGTVVTAQGDIDLTAPGYVITVQEAGLSLTEMLRGARLYVEVPPSARAANKGKPWAEFELPSGQEPGAVSGPGRAPTGPMLTAVDPAPMLDLLRMAPAGATLLGPEASTGGKQRSTAFPTPPASSPGRRGAVSPGRGS